MRFGPAVFRDDVELDRSLTTFGPATAKGNLTALASMKVHGPCVIQGALTIEESLAVNGPLKIGKSFVCREDSQIKINGPVTVGQGIMGGNIRINGPLSAQFVESVFLNVNGPIRVEEDLFVEEEIKFGVGHRTSRTPFIDVGGIIEAPIIHFKSYAGKFSPGGVIKKIFGIQPKYNRGKIVLEGLTIRTKLLRLEGVELENCEIEAEEIEEIEGSDW
ncbi:MAG: hypothetical protein ACXADY_17855 [Candidatus Hodarchaeales archaeon]|jgi:hypothetical protein